MYEKIAELIAKNVNEPINVKYINDLINIVIEEYDLIDVITDEDKVFLSDIQNYTIELIKTSRLDFFPNRNLEKKYYSYLYITRLVLEKLELASLKRRYKENVRISPIVSMSLKQWEKVCNDKKQLNENKNGHYKVNHQLLREFSPEKRISKIASFDSIDEISDILNKEELNHVNLIEFGNMLIKPYIRLKEERYFTDSKQNSPTLLYLEQIGCSKKELKSLTRLSEKFSLETRLRNGLEVNEDIINSYARTLNLK